MQYDQGKKSKGERGFVGLSNDNTKGPFLSVIVNKYIHCTIVRLNYIESAGSKYHPVLNLWKQL